MAQYKIFLSACEASAEKHCLELMTSIKDKVAREGGQVSFSGIGGKKMQEAGCEIIADTVSRAAMIYNAFGQVGYYYKLIKKVKCFLQENPQDVVVVCDSPAFNFHIAKAAKKANTKVLFYVAPQLWAWAPWRIHKLKRCCDRLACILPFEEKWFSDRGVKAEFVGNPLFDEIDVNIDQCLKSYDLYKPESAKIALLPGSRKAEIDSLWKPMQQIAVNLKKRYPAIRFVAVGSDEEKLDILRASQISGFECEYRLDKVIDTCRQVDYAFVASGSATLQVASAACPMTVMYQSNKLLWHLLGRWLINIKHLSLVNILASKRLVPEYMPYFDSVEPISDEACLLLSDKNSLKTTSEALVELVKPLADFKTCNAVADIVLDICDSN
ncbi:MAG: lipid-A-disaccharide synthase [Sedimentisphaeraceae bacterium JB056]